MGPRASQEGSPMTVEQEAPGRAPREAGRARIDCEIHNVVPSTEALFPYLSEHWRESVTQTLFKGVADASYPRNAPTTARPESKAGDGPPGSSLELLREQ